MSFLTDAEQTIQEAAEAVASGTMTDSLRVRLYRIAVTLAGEEFYRIEKVSAGTVSPQMLTVMQQIVSLCDDPELADKLVEAGGSD